MVRSIWALDLTFKEKTMRPINIEEVSRMAEEFETNTGKRPTHILMTVEQQDQLSEAAKAKQQYATLDGDHAQSKVVTIQVTHNNTVDILAVAASRTGKTHEIDYPVLVVIPADYPSLKALSEGVVEVEITEKAPESTTEN